MYKNCRFIITGSAVSLQCCNGRSKNNKMGISTPCRIATFQNFILKFGTRDCVRNITPHADFGAHRLGGGTQIRKILRKLCLMPRAVCEFVDMQLSNIAQSPYDAQGIGLNLFCYITI